MYFLNGDVSLQRCYLISTNIYHARTGLSASWSWRAAVGGILPGSSLVVPDMNVGHHVIHCIYDFFFPEDLGR